VTDVVVLFVVSGELFEREGPAAFITGENFLIEFVEGRRVEEGSVVAKELIEDSVHSAVDAAADHLDDFVEICVFELP